MTKDEIATSRILIIGCPGSGKSTFARKLATLTGLPLYYLDMLWHKADRTTVSREEFDIELDRILQRDKWIIDGNYTRTLRHRIKMCETVFLFDLPTEVCIEGVKQRIGPFTTDMPWVERELYEDFRQWLLNFRKVQLPEIRSILSERGAHVKLIIFRSRLEADAYIGSPA